MGKILKDKRVVLLASLLALVALMLLGSALRDVSFRPARQLSGSESETVQISVDEVVKRMEEVPVWKQIVFWILVFFFVLLVSALLSPEMRKRLLMGLLRLSLPVILILFIMKKNPGLLEGLFAFAALGANSAGPASADSAPAPVFEPPHISVWLSFLITLGIVVFLSFLAWRMNRWWARRNELLALQRPLGELAEIARTSLAELSLGNVPSHEAIIQCYERMSWTVSTRRGLARDTAMTPAEFALRLERAGLPHAPVNRLTRLFESVRYGARSSQPPEVEEAVSCLTSILSYCGESV